MSGWQLLSATVVTLALLVVYTVLTLTSHDASAILGALVGYLSGASATVGVAKVTGGIAPGRNGGK